MGTGRRNQLLPLPDSIYYQNKWGRVSTLKNKPPNQSQKVKPDKISRKKVALKVGSYICPLISKFSSLFLIVTQKHQISCMPAYPTFPAIETAGIIGFKRFHFSVRNGKRWFTLKLNTGKQEIWCFFTSSQ